MFLYCIAQRMSLRNVLSKSNLRAKNLRCSNYLVRTYFMKTSTIFKKKYTHNYIIFFWCCMQRGMHSYIQLKTVQFLFISHLVWQITQHLFRRSLSCIYGKWPFYLDLPNERVCCTQTRPQATTNFHIHISSATICGNTPRVQHWDGWTSAASWRRHIFYGRVNAFVCVCM